MAVAEFVAGPLIYKTSIRMYNFVTLVLDNLIFDGFDSKCGCY